MVSSLGRLYFLNHSLLVTISYLWHSFQLLIVQDILVTIIVAWILFRLFRPVVFVQSHKHYHSHSSTNQQAEGEMKVTKKPSQNKDSNSSGNDGEYVDFEELPKS